MMNNMFKICHVTYLDRYLDQYIQKCNYREKQDLVVLCRKVVVVSEESEVVVYRAFHQLVPSIQRVARLWIPPKIALRLTLEGDHTTVA